MLEKTAFSFTTVKTFVIDTTTQEIFEKLHKSIINHHHIKLTEVAIIVVLKPRSLNILTDSWK